MLYSLGIFSYSTGNEDMQSCRLCHEDVSDGIHLSDGGLVHYECVKSLEDEASKFANELSILRNEVRQYENELVYRKTISFRIKSIFSKPTVDSSEIEKLISSRKHKITEILESFQDIHSRLSVVYDFYLTYPPDWEDRKAEELLSIVGDGIFSQRILSSIIFMPPALPGPSVRHQ